MRQFTILIGLLMMLGGTAQAQIQDRLMPHFGFAYDFISARKADVPIPINNYGNLNVGAYYLLYHKSDLVSVGIEPNVGFSFRPFSFSPLVANYLFQAPVFAMARVGAGSTPYNEQRLGLALGIGGTYSAYSFVFSTGRSERVNYITPSAVVEVHINAIANPIILRAHASLTQVPVNYRLLELNGEPAPSGIDPRIDQAGYVSLGLIYNFSLR